MYHHIAEVGSGNTLATTYFEEHLKLLSTLEDYTIVSLSEYLKFENKRQIAITFDDAYCSILELVLPLIQRYSIPISIFVPTAHVGKYNVWDVVNGENIIPIMNWEQLREISKEPLVTIGSHGCNHVSIGEVGETCYEQEFKLSKQELEEKLTIPIHYFAYPYGQLQNCVTNEKEHFFQKWGYTAYLTTNWSRFNSLKNWYTLNRIEILGSTDAVKLKQIIYRKIDWKSLKQKIKNGIFFRK